MNQERILKFVKKGLQNFNKMVSACREYGNTAYNHTTKTYSAELYTKGWVMYTLGGIHAAMDGKSLEAIEGTAQLNWDVVKTDTFKKYYKENIRIHCCIDRNNDY